MFIILSAIVLSLYIPVTFLIFSTLLKWNNDNADDDDEATDEERIEAAPAGVQYSSP